MYIHLTYIFIYSCTTYCVIGLTTKIFLNKILKNFHFSASSFNFFKKYSIIVETKIHFACVHVCGFPLFQENINQKGNSKKEESQIEDFKSILKFQKKWIESICICKYPHGEVFSLFFF